MPTDRKEYSKKRYQRYKEQRIKKQEETNKQIEKLKLTYKEKFRYYDNLVNNLDIILKILNINKSILAEILGMSRQNFHAKFIRTTTSMSKVTYLSILNLIESYEKTEEQDLLLDIFLYNPEKYNATEIVLIKNLLMKPRTMRR